MTGDDYELSSLLGGGQADSGVADGQALLRFVDAVLQGSPEELGSARESVLTAIGPAAFVDACATVASFNAVVKIADGTGIPLEDAKAERTRDLRAELGIDTLRAADQRG